MPGKSLNGKKFGGNVGVEQVIDGQVKPAQMGLGMELRTRARLYPEILGIPRSVYYQTNYINTTERSMGMPQSSGQDIYTRLTGTTGSALQISSSSASDAVALGGAITIYIDGIYIDGDKWLNRSTFSTPTTLTGQTAVQIGVLDDWYRINKIWVLTTGVINSNIGDLYISPMGTALTLGVPDSDILSSVIAGYSNSSGGFFSVATNQRFNYTKGNFWVASGKEIRFREHFYQDFRGSANTADMTYYEVGLYVGASTGYDYESAAPYSALTDIGMNVLLDSGSAQTAATMYVEYCLNDAMEVKL
jgi:hypothetical protein